MVSDTQDTETYYTISHRQYRSIRTTHKLRIKLIGNKARYIYLNLVGLNRAYETSFIDIFCWFVDNYA